jgi:hypothetical protein
MSRTEPGGPPPWYHPEIQEQVEWRDRDIVISVPIKSGTTWTMNIVYQLLTGGDPDFADIYAEVPWLELLEAPGQSPQVILDRIAAMRRDRPRAFKSHSAPPELPYIEPGSGTNVRYVVVCRNPEEAVVSIKPFLAQHTDAWYELWGLPKAAVVRPDFPTFYEEVVDPAGMHRMLFGFLAAWWPLRHNDNVLLIHYADMKRDHAGSLRRIADFLEIAPTPSQWEAVSRYTSFDWMKAHQQKFEARTITRIPILESGAMIRKGRLGEARSDGMTETISARLGEVGREICPDAAALDWFYSGGPLPG